MGVAGGGAGGEAGRGFEAVAWARLEPALSGSRRDSWISWFVFSPARLAFAAGVILLICAAFMAGRMTRATAPGGARATQSAAPVRERIPPFDPRDPLDRSPMVLVGLASGGGRRRQARH